MEPDNRVEMSRENRFCSECGSEESGYFCRACGTLLRGEEMILCPRCHQIVPDGKFCNQCGQRLFGIALHLRQLAQAGDEFWMTSATPKATISETLAPEPDLVAFDESLIMSDTEVPDWLEELSSPLVRADSRIHPMLKPIEKERGVRLRSTVFTAAILLMFSLMVGLAFLAVFVLLRGGG
jgi:hypothetical protein